MALSGKGPFLSGTCLKMSACFPDLLRLFSQISSPQILYIVWALFESTKGKAGVENKKLSQLGDY